MTEKEERRLIKGGMKITDKQKNYIRAIAIEQKNKERILAVNKRADENSGIYIFTRREDDIRYAYVGQAKHLLTRLAQHLSGYQHIDCSIKKHGLFDVNKNLGGWNIDINHCLEEDLDAEEQKYIKSYASKGYQLYNHTTGGQGEGKRALGEGKSPKGYRDGIAQGRKNLIKEIRHLFDLHLKTVYKADKPSKNAEKAMRKFNEILQVENDNKVTNFTK